MKEIGAQCDKRANLSSNHVEHSTSRIMSSTCDFGITETIMKRIITVLSDSWVHHEKQSSAIARDFFFTYNYDRLQVSKKLRWPQ